jgi:hypothetical protein
VNSRLGENENIKWEVYMERRLQWFEDMDGEGCY